MMGTRIRCGSFVYSEALLKRAGSNIASVFPLPVAAASKLLSPLRQGPLIYLVAPIFPPSHVAGELILVSLHMDSVPPPQGMAGQLGGPAGWVFDSPASLGCRALT